MTSDAESYLKKLEEIQNGTTTQATIFNQTPDEEKFIINADTREISVPSSFSNIGVIYDHNAETIFFKIPRYFDNVDLNDHTCIIQYINAGKEEDIYTVTQKDLSSDGEIIFGWKITNSVTKYSGSVSFAVRFYSITNGIFDYNFNTKVAQFNVLSGLNITANDISINPDLLSQWIEKINALDNIELPMRTSDLINDSNFLSSETDPTVPKWAKQSEKPIYTAQEVGAISISSEITNDEIDGLDELFYIPKFKNSDVLVGGDNNTHPAFIVNGKEIPGFYYSKYQNVVKTVDGASMAYSLYGKDPAVNIDFDNARARCEAKGKGYHLSTMAEWAAIALWCKKNGFMPYGNNNYGKDTLETDYVAIPTSQDTADPNKTGHVATGTGPLTWSHDETPSGIWDLNGNVWEWQGGYRTVSGEVQILANNDAADSNNLQNNTSQCWKAINATTGELVTPGTSGTVKLDYVSSKWTYSASITDLKNEIRGCAFANVTFTSDVKQPAQDLLRALAMLPVAGDTSYNNAYFWVNNGVAERLAFRGGNWDSGTRAGVFSVHGGHPRSSAYTYIGFRFTYIQELEP
ncbi:hypothetical protein K413DRAFT_4770 [Clostridium sp. ASBs410]|nr:hypothetical protein K413DRAFT_4770 [Clostridium sp. ASBs410]